MLLAELLFAFSAMLLIVRLLSWGNEGYLYAALDFIAIMFMIFAFYFFVFGATSSLSTVSVATNQSSLGNVITTTSQVATQAAVGVNSAGFIMLVIVTASYSLIMGILGLRDFLASRQIIRGNI